MQFDHEHYWATFWESCFHIRHKISVSTYFLLFWSSSNAGLYCQIILYTMGFSMMLYIQYVVHWKMNVQYGTWPRMPWCHNQNLDSWKKKINTFFSAPLNSVVHKHRVNNKADKSPFPSLKVQKHHTSMKSQYLQGGRQLNLCFFSRFPQSLEGHVVLG